MDNRFYVYAYVNPTRPGRFTYPELNMSFLYEPFYIGKGTKDRKTAHLQPSIIKKTAHTDKTKLIIELIALGHNLANYLILCENYKTDQEALRLEEIYVDMIGRKIINRGPLLNSSAGGQVNKIGCRSNSKLDKLSKHDINQICMAYSEGMDCNKLGEMYTMSAATISRVLKLGGAKTRRGGNKPRSFDTTGDFIVRGEYLSGRTLRELADKYAVSHIAIIESLKRTNTPRRSSHTRKKKKRK